MSKEKRALIESLTPENRNILLLLQMRMGVYLDIETDICKRVNVILHGGKEYLCPAPNPSIMMGIDMNMRPLQLNPEGRIFLSPLSVQLDNTSKYAGMLDIMVSGAELREGMRRASVERKGFKRVGMGRPTPVHATGEFEYAQGNERRILGEAGMAMVSGAMLAEVGTYRSATKALATGRGRLGHSEYFFRKMHLGLPPKLTWRTRMRLKWLSFKIRTARRFHKAVDFVKSLFNR